MDGAEIKFDARFAGNILVVGQTGCGKTTFVQNLGLNRMFSDIKTVDWISKITLSRGREDQLREIFSYVSFEFHYPEDLGEFETLLETFRDEEIEEENLNVNSIVMGENRKLDRLIVMGKVSGLADKSNKFSTFLTVSQKIDYSCLYHFHIIFPNISTWQIILAQTKIFNIFPSAIQLGNILKILMDNCDRDTIKYIPARDLQINRLYFTIANDRKYSCLTIDCTKRGPSKYRTNADNNLEQTKKDTVCNKFSARNLNENPYDLTLTIDRVTKTLEKTRQKPYGLIQSDGDNLTKNEKDGREPDSGTAERNDKGDDRGREKGRKRPQFLLL